jgi:hypothetical protein
LRRFPHAHKGIGSFPADDLVSILENGNYGNSLGRGRQQTGPNRGR